MVGWMEASSLRPFHTLWWKTVKHTLAILRCVHCKILELCSTIFTLCIIGLMSPNFFHIFFPHMFRNKLYLDKKHRITKFCYWATKISLKCFLRKLFLKRLLSRNAKKYLLQLAKIPKTNRSWSERYVLNLF